MKNNATSLLKMAKSLFSNSERANAEVRWAEAAEYILNNQFSHFLGDTPIGSKKTKNIFDSTGMQSANDLASIFHSTITNPAVAWSKVRMKDNELNNNIEVRRWLDTVNTAIVSAFNESNFDSMISKCFKSHVVFSNMVLLHEADENGDLNFNAWHLGQVAFTENNKGLVDKVVRKFKLTARQADQEFDTLPDKIRECLEEKPEEEFEFFHIIQENTENVKIATPDAPKLPSRNRPFMSYYISELGPDILKQEGHHEFPVHISRWETLTGEVYGRGVTDIAVGFVKMLNKVREIGMEALEMDLYPARLVSRRDVLGTFNFAPRGVTVVNDVDTAVKLLDSGGDKQREQFNVQDMRQTIKEAYFIDKLILPPRTETGEQTAVEINARLAQVQRVLGSVVSRFNSEFLTPLVLRTFHQLLRAERIPPIPEVVKESGVDIEIKFVNQLNRAQEFDVLNNMDTFVQKAIGFAQQADPQVLDLINGDEYLKLNGKSMDIPESIFRNNEEVANIRQQRNQSQQQQQLLDSQVKLADINSKGSGNV